MNCLSDTPVNQSIRPCQLGVTLRNCSESFEPLDRILPLVRGEALLEIHPAFHGLSSQPILFWRGHTPLVSSRRPQFEHYSVLFAAPPSRAGRTPGVAHRLCVSEHRTTAQRSPANRRHTGGHLLLRSPSLLTANSPLRPAPVLRPHSAKPVFRSKSGLKVGRAVLACYG